MAVKEAARILKKGGILFAAGINRLAYFKDLLRAVLMAATARREFHAQFLKDGNLNSSNAPLIGPAHLTTIGEFRDLFKKTFEEITLLGVESFSSQCQELFIEMSPSNKSAWLELIEKTASTPGGLGASDHFLFVGRKIKSQN